MTPLFALTILVCVVALAWWHRRQARLEAPQEPAPTPTQARERVQAIKRRARYVAPEELVDLRVLARPKADR
jgi:hypothetical protein